MAWTLINQTKWADVGTSLSLSINTSLADLLVMSLGWYPQIDTIDLPTDSKGNFWQALTLSHVSFPIATRIWYSIPTSVGSSHGFQYNTHSGGAVFAGAIVTAWSGAKQTGVLDVEAVSEAAASTLAVGPITPSQPGSLIICANGHENNSGAAASINSGFTIADEVMYSAGANESTAQAYLKQGAAAAVTPTWDITNSAYIAGAVAVFKPAVVSSLAIPMLPSRRRFYRMPF